MWTQGDICKFIVSEDNEPSYSLTGVIYHIDKSGREGVEYYVEVISDIENGSTYILHENDLMSTNEDNTADEVDETTDTVEDFVNWVYNTYNNDIPIKEIYELYRNRNKI